MCACVHAIEYVCGNACPYTTYVTAGLGGGGLRTCVCVRVHARVCVCVSACPYTTYVTAGVRST